MAQLPDLKELKNNNSREWFEPQKSRFKKLQVEIKEGIQYIENGLNATDVIEKHKLFRIYRDIRYSKDKTPFQPHFAMSWARAGAGASPVTSSDSVSSPSGHRKRA